MIAQTGRSVLTGVLSEMENGKKRQEAKDSQSVWMEGGMWMCSDDPVRMLMMLLMLMLTLIL